MDFQEFMSVTTDAFFIVYKNNIKELGILGAELTTQTIQFYINIFGLVEDATKTIPLLWNAAQNMYPNDELKAKKVFTNGYKKLLVKDLALLKETIRAGKALLITLKSLI